MVKVLAGWLTAGGLLAGVIFVSLYYFNYGSKMVFLAFQRATLWIVGASLLYLLGDILEKRKGKLK